MQTLAHIIIDDLKAHGYEDCTMDDIKRCVRIACTVSGLNFTTTEINKVYDSVMEVMHPLMYRDR